MVATFCATDCTRQISRNKVSLLENKSGELCKRKKRLRGATNKRAKDQPPLPARFPIPLSSCCYMYQPQLRTPTQSSENTRKAANLVQVFMIGRRIRNGGQGAAYIPGWPGLRLEGSMVPKLSMLLYSSGSSCICSCN